MRVDEAKREVLYRRTFFRGSDLCYVDFHSFWPGGNYLALPFQVKKGRVILHLAQPLNDLPVHELHEDGDVDGTA